MSQKTETFNIQGMSCGHCVRAVREALDETQGVDVESVEIGTATVRYDPDQTSRDRIEAAIEEAGYTLAG